MRTLESVPSYSDYFCGYGGSSQGARKLGLNIRMAANHWDLAVATHSLNFPDSDHDQADISGTDPRRHPTTTIAWFSPECFPAGTLVTTVRGQVPIEDVQIGDVALTHRGRWREVVRTQHRQADTIVLRGQGHAGLEVTPNHRLWARSSEKQWQTSPRGYRRQYGEPGWMRSDELVNREALWATPTQVAPLPVSEPPLVFGLDVAAAWWLVGRWVGDGSLTFGRNHEVLITCGFHEADELRERLADTGHPWAESRKRTAVVFSTGVEKARDWLHEHFGHGAANKGLPSFTLAMPRAHRQALLDGYVSADGNITQRRARISTVSRRLAVSARLLAETLGLRVSVAIDKRTTYCIEGRTGLARQQWVMHWEPTLSTRRSPEAFQDGPHAWSRVRSTDPGRAGVTVYNIEVHEDHSYVADGIVVANCTNHSMARGKKRQSLSTQLAFGEEAPPLPDAAAERSRATMWDVPRFAEYHRYRYVIVENVVDARYWVGWFAWLQAMAAMEYEHEVVYLNSMHAGSDVAAPAPQSRDRMYVVFWQRGERKPNLAITPPAWCGRCDRQVMAVQAFKKAERWGRYRAQYLYRCPSCMTAVEPYTLPAAVAIDWKQPGQRIGDRVKPLAPKTVARIKAGIERYGRPFHLEAAGNQYDAADPKHRQHGQPTAYMRVWPADTEPLRTLHTIESKALLVPVEGREGKEARTAGEPLRTMTTRNETALALPPMITVHRGGADARRTSLATEAMPTFTASGNTHSLVVPPFIAELRGGGSKHRPVTDPLATMTASGTHHGLVQPPDLALVMRNNSSKGDGAEMSTPASEPLRTLTTTGHQSLITWQALYGYDGGGLRSLGTPMPTQTTVQGDGLLSGAGLPDVEDCLFRMLEPAEIGLGMAFEPDYQVLGNKREQVRGYGNAVTPCAGSLLLGRVVAALTGEVAA